MPKTLLPRPTITSFFPWPIVLVSTVDEAGKPNIITLGASCVCCADPPVIGIAMGLSRYSLGLMQRTGDFGVNLPTAEQARETDFCGSRSGRDTDKFAECGFTAQPATQITSPLILECPVSFECKIVQTAHLGSHDWVMGEIVAVHIAEELLDERGNLASARVHPLLSLWGEYWTLGEKLERWGGYGG